MAKFNIGDRVQFTGGDNTHLIKGMVGTVLEDNASPYVEWDDFYEGHSGIYRDDRKTCWCVTEQALERVKKSPKDSRGGGLKYDAGKPQARLLHEGMPLALARVIDTLTFGAQKYAAHSWQTVPNALERYQDASYRHDSKRAQGEKLDEETKIHHRAHHIINELFLLELELRQEKADAQ